jgi:hypothetical protein
MRAPDYPTAARVVGPPEPISGPDGAASSPGTRQVILLHIEAPLKPAVGQPCNGCGACCASEPCPLGVLVSGHLSGPCRALAWSEPERIYRCNMVSAPERLWPMLPGFARRLVSRLSRRWIASAIGCDASLQVESD